MDFLPALLARRRLVLATASLLALAGVFSWLTMPREEDPQFPPRDGLLVVSFPGADAESVERLVIEPLEEHLAEVEEIHDVWSTARAGAAIIRIEFHEFVYDTETGWDEVEEAMERARQEFPAGVGEMTLDDELVDQEAVVLAITGSVDPLVLAEGSERVKRSLLSIESVKLVEEIADPGEQITIEYDDAVARRLGVDPRRLGEQLGLRSRIVPGGIIHLGPKTANLRPRTEFFSVEEIESTPIVLDSGDSVPLGTLARVRRGPEEPPRERMRWNGEPAVGLGIVPKAGLDRVRFGEAVRRSVAELASEIAPLEISEVAFQPDMVDRRLDQLAGSLRLGILIVTGVLFVAMGLRLGVLVALVLPLVTMSSIAIFAGVGGILHQISIAALVIALGMLVDNAIVMVESIQWRLDHGMPVRQAAAESVRELALPLGTATGTTLAAFVPMLVSKGNTADFTRDIPWLIMLTLTVSYLFAVTVTPVLSEFFLRPKDQGEGPSRSVRLARAIGRVAVGRPIWVLLGAAGLLGATVMAAGYIDREFFPPADRDIVVIQVEMPEGTHLEETDEVARRLERDFATRPDIASVASFMGRGAPHFYYNLVTKPNSPHRAEIIVRVTDLDRVDEVMAWARDHLRRAAPEAEAVIRRLEQGPPLDAPIEVRLYGHDLIELEDTADAVLAAMRQVPGTLDTRHDLGLGVPTVTFAIDDAAAGRHGLSRTDVALALLGRTLGAEIGQYRMGEDPVPILVRSSAGEKLPPLDLTSIDVATPGGEPVPLSRVARLDVEWRPAAIHHHERSRMVRVQAQLAEGITAHETLGALQPALAGLELPPGVRLVFGGELEESGKANAAILRTLPFGVLLLLFFLLLEFNSFRRLAIVLVTVPLAATGVVPGLLLSDQPFGFMSMLGVVSLVGIVVNNAIVLIDVIENRRAEGSTIEQALLEAIARRTRPILLTMATTVAGLLPLAYASSTLWPPLAWAMISGLMASTVLTLLVVPALYRMLFQPPKARWWSIGGRPTKVAATASLIALALILPGVSRAEPVALTLEEAMQRAASRPSLIAAQRRTAAAESLALAERRTAILPSVSVVGNATRRDRDFEFTTPIGDFTLGERTSSALVVEVEQPLLDPARRFYRAPAASSEAGAAAERTERLKKESRAEAARRFVRILEIDGRRRVVDAFIESLAARLLEMEERVAAGQMLAADVLKVRLDLESAELDRVRLDQARRVAVRELGRAVGAEGAVEPRFDGQFDRSEDVAIEELIARARATRKDLRALELEIAARGLEARAVRAERLPRLSLRGRWQSTDGDPFRPEELLEGIVMVSWNPFASGTRGPRAAALESEEEALRADLIELRRTVEVEVEGAVAQLRTAREAVEVRQRGVELASETLRVEQERHQAGRATTNDLLDAEAELRRQRTEGELARLDVLLAWVGVDLAVGG